jgi:hypothetical protein
MSLSNDDFMKYLAWRQLLHETADEGLKEAIVRGVDQETGEMSIGTGAFIDGLAAQVDALKEELRAELSNPGSAKSSNTFNQNEQLERIAFEMGELRGQVESLRATVDAIAAKVL